MGEEIRMAMRDVLVEFGIKPAIPTDIEYYIVKSQLLDDGPISRAVKSYDPNVEIYRYRCERRVDKNRVQYFPNNDEIILLNPKSLISFLVASNFSCLLSERPERQLLFLYAAKSFSALSTEASGMRRSRTLAEIMGVMVDGNKEIFTPSKNSESYRSYVKLLQKLWTKESYVPVSYSKNQQIIDNWKAKQGDGINVVRDFRSKFNLPISHGVHIEEWHVDLPKNEKIVFNSMRRIPGQWVQLTEIANIIRSLYDITLSQMEIISCLQNLTPKFGIEKRVCVIIGHEHEYSFSNKAYKKNSGQRTCTKEDSILECLFKHPNAWFSIIELSRMTGFKKAKTIEDLEYLIQQGSVKVSDNNLHQYRYRLKEKPPEDINVKTSSLKNMVSKVVNDRTLLTVNISDNESRILQLFISHKDQHGSSLEDILRLTKDQIHDGQPPIFEDSVKQVLKSLETKDIIEKTIGLVGKVTSYYYSLLPWVESCSENKVVFNLLKMRKRIAKTNPTIQEGDWVLMSYDKISYPAIVIPECANDKNICRLKGRYLSIYFSRNFAVSATLEEVFPISMVAPITEIDQENIIKIDRDQCSENVWERFKELDLDKPIVRKYREIFQDEKIQLIKNLNKEELDDINPHIWNNVKHIKVGQEFQAKHIGQNHPRQNIKCNRDDVIWIEPTLKQGLIFHPAVAIPDHYFTLVKNSMREAILETEDSNRACWNDEFIEKISEKIIKVFYRYPNIWLSLDEIKELIYDDSNCSTVAIRAALKRYIEDDYSIGIVRKPNTRYFMFDPVYCTMNQLEYEIFRYLQENPNRDVDFTEIEKATSTVDKNKLKTALESITNNSLLRVSVSGWADENVDCGFYNFDSDYYGSHRDYKSIFEQSQTVSPIEAAVIDYLIQKPSFTENTDITNYIMDLDDRDWFEKKIHIEDVEAAIQSLLDLELLLSSPVISIGGDVCRFKIGERFGGWSHPPEPYKTSQKTEFELYIDDKDLEEVVDIPIVVSAYQWSIINFMYDLSQGIVKLHSDRVGVYSNDFKRVHAKDMLLHLTTRHVKTTMNDVTNTLCHLRDYGIIIDHHDALLKKAPENPPSPNKDIEEVKQELLEWEEAKKEKKKPRWSLNPAFTGIYDGVTFDELTGYYSARKDAWSFEGTTIVNGNEPIKTVDKHGTIIYKLNDLIHREDGPAREFTDGTKHWYKNGFLHREDGPAMELANGAKYWYINGKKLTEEEFAKRDKPTRTVDANKTITYKLNGKLHRDDGPAIEHANGEKYWYKNGQKHREDGPAIETFNGSKYWYINGERHREDGPACEYVNGDKEWYLRNKKVKKEALNKQPIKTLDSSGNMYYTCGKNLLHREDGPAVERINGDKEWWLNGKLHRADGPAVEKYNGVKMWYIDGKRVKKKSSSKTPTKTVDGNCNIYYKLNGEFHREDGPAIEYKSGTKMWYKNGEYHREDGPAIEYGTGERLWYIYGKQLTIEQFEDYTKPIKTIENNGNIVYKTGNQFHREDGPAIVLSDGSYFWWLNGKRHRVDGPASVWSDGTRHWFLNGEYHREDGPAIEEANGTKYWYKHGKLHREDGPAYEYYNGNKMWYINGKQHREDGPAVELSNGDKAWWFDGKLHREDGPAIEPANGTKYWYRNGVNFNEKEFNLPSKTISGDETVRYTLNGKYHREDGPAIEWANGNKYWYLDGLLHRTDGPAIDRFNGDKKYYIHGKELAEEEFNKRPTVDKDGAIAYKSNKQLDVPAVVWVNGNKHWYINEKLHREDGPACEFASGTKQWYKNGQKHREDGPAIEYITGAKKWFINGKELTEEEFNKRPTVGKDGAIYYKLNNKHHRKDGPAVEYANGAKHWYINGKRHREDGPAIEYADGAKHWYINGQYHREDGPAIEWASGTKYWYINGKELTEEEFNKRQLELLKMVVFSIN